MNSNMIHIKAHYNGNIRRFQSKTEWSVLLKHLQELFQIDASLPVKVQYRDDENDLCTISTQMELESAVPSDSLLRLFLSAPVAPACPVRQTSQSCKPFPCARLSAIKIETEMPPRFVERLNRRKSMIEATQQSTPCFEKARCWGRRASNDSVVFGPAARLERINKFLEEPDLPAQRRERLLLKKAWLEEKIQNRSCPAPESPIAVPDTAERPCHGRWGPAHRLAKIQERLNQPNLPPHCVERLNQHKARIEERMNQCPKAERPCHGPASRLEWIQLKLADPTLPPHRVEKLNLKKTMLEAWMKQQTAPGSACSPMFRPEFRLDWINKKLATPNLPPHCVERLTAKKAMLEEKLKPQCSSEAPFPSRLEARLAWIQKRLVDPSLPAHKLEKLNQKKAAIEAKLKADKQHPIPEQQMHCPRKMWGCRVAAEGTCCRRRK